MLIYHIFIHFSTIFIIRLKQLHIQMTIRKISFRFQISSIFLGPSVQVILDWIPTAQIVDEVNGKKIIEAEVEAMRRLHF